MRKFRKDTEIFEPLSLSFSPSANSIIIKYYNYDYYKILLLCTCWKMEKFQKIVVNDRILFARVMTKPKAIKYNINVFFSLPDTWE